MKKTTLIFAFALISGIVFSQEKREKGKKFSNNAFFIEILGNALPVTLNYEHIWTKNGVVNVGTTFGVSYIPLEKYTTANGTFEVDVLFGRSKHMLDMGFGWTTAYLHDIPNEDHYGVINQTFRMAYRYQQPNGGFFFRGGFVANSNVIGVTDDLIKTAIWNTLIKRWAKYTLPSISLGYTF